MTLLDMSQKSHGVYKHPFEHSKMEHGEISPIRIPITTTYQFSLILVLKHHIALLDKMHLST